MTAPDGPRGPQLPTTPADGEPAFRWPARPLRTMVLLSLLAHAALGTAFWIGAAGDRVATDAAAAGDAPGAAAALRHVMPVTPVRGLPPGAGPDRHPRPGTTAATAADTSTLANERTASAPAGTAAAGSAPATGIAGPDATPAPAAGASRADLDELRRRYLASLAPLLARQLAYPAAARRLGLEGRVIVGLRIARDGSVQALAVHRGSGQRLLDEGALETVRRASPLPPLPDGLPEATLEVELPLSFGLAPND